jgi:hypothetical protein
LDRNEYRVGIAGTLSEGPDLFTKMKRAWHKFAERPPGKRFKQMYDEHQKAGKSGTKRIVLVVVGVVIIAAGLVALPAPGPGTLVIALGAGMVARESEKLATALDTLELFLRKLWKRVRARFA